MLLTAKGRKLFDRIRRHDQRAIEELFAGVPAKAQQQTRTTLAKLLAKLESEGDLS